MSRLQAVADELGLTMTAQFVPFSKSRNAKPDPKLKDLSLNWRVTFLLSGREILTTDYMQGIAYAPAYDAYQKEGRLTIYHWGQLLGECEKGRKAPRMGATFFSDGPLTPPSLCSVLESLLNDAAILDFPNFESWAGEYGYDSDSRAAEKIYKACLNIGLALNAALGPEGITRLNGAIYEDQNS